MAIINKLMGIHIHQEYQPNITHKLIQNNKNLFFLIHKV